MSQACAHDGWGLLGYAGESGPCPPSAEMVSIPGGVECPVCKFHVVTVTGDNINTYLAKVQGGE